MSCQPESSLGSIIYLDNHSYPCDPGVVEAMLPFLRGSFGNPRALSTFWAKQRSGR